jgi:hypothetical protein
MVEVRAANDVRFFVDPDVSNGVSFTECGTGSATNIPAGNLAPQIMVRNAATGGAATDLDVDFFRAWQDDETAPAENPTLVAENAAMANAGAEVWQLARVKPDFAASSSLSQMFPSENLAMEAGTLVSLIGDGALVNWSLAPNDPYLVGVTVDSPGIEISNGTFDGIRVAIAGRAKVKVTGENGPIQVGDYLTSSSTPGVAMRSSGHGKVLGQALTAYTEEEENAIGSVVVLIAPSPAISGAGGAREGSEALLVLSSGLLLNGGLEVDQIGGSSALAAVLQGQVRFGQTYVNKDTAGFAVIRANQQAVHVAFSEPYQYEPSVSATITLPRGNQDMDRIFGEDLRYIITQKDKEGFTISLNKPTALDVPFSWIALAAKEGEVIDQPEPVRQEADDFEQQPEVADIVPEDPAEEIVSEEDAAQEEEIVLPEEGESAPVPEDATDIPLMEEPAEEAVPSLEESPEPASDPATEPESESEPSV